MSVKPDLMFRLYPIMRKTEEILYMSEAKTISDALGISFVDMLKAVGY